MKLSVHTRRLSNKITSRWDPSPRYIISISYASLRPRIFGFIGDSPTNVYCYVSAIIWKRDWRLQSLVLEIIQYKVAWQCLTLMAIINESANFTGIFKSLLRSVSKWYSNIHEKNWKHSICVWWRLMRNSLLELPSILKLMFPRGRIHFGSFAIYYALWCKLCFYRI